MKKDRRGFALLLIFMMAASVCIFLYMQMPRVAFEAQRAKEELLVQRGEQYKRAIQLFVRKNAGKFPSKIEDLENFNGIRFLRRRYVDPMTGKDEWRLIHVGPGGVLTDSVVTKPQGTDKDQKKSENNFITEVQGLGATTQGPGAGANLALRQRASDRPGAPGSAPGSGPGQPVDPNAQPGSDPQPGQQLLPGQTYPGLPLQPGQQQPGQQQPQPGQPGAQFPGQQVQGPPGQVGQPANPFQQPGQQQQAYPGQPTQVSQGYPSGVYPGGGQTTGATGAPQPGQPGAPNPGLDMIQKLLTTPRPGGMPGSATSTSGQVVGGGIAGVASKYEGDSIKVYKDRQKYNEWEFVYDMKEDVQKQMGAAGIQQPQNQQGQNPLGQRPAISSPSRQP